MAKKLTYKEVSKVYEEKGYELISEYKGNNKPLFVKDKEGYICSSSYSSFKNGAEPNKFHTHNPYTIQNIKLWMKINAVGYELLSNEYKNNSSKLLFKCINGHEFEISWSKFQWGDRCPYCSNHKIKLGINTIWDTDRWMCDLGISEEDAKKYSKSSKNKIKVICPNCGKEKETSLNKIYNRKSISCTCGDGISYPEKFVILILNQLNIKYIKEYSPKWSNNCRYDFYLLDYNTIIECHGRQHYKQIYRKGKRARNLQEEQENDKLKKELALDNGINEYIILDCRESNSNWIKNSILNSKLNDMFNLNNSNIDWLKCEEFALSNRVKEVCDYWKEHNNISNEDLTTVDIGDIFNLNYNTISNYLKKGNELGWCNYNPKEEIKKISKKVGKSLSKPIEIFKNGESLGVFPSCAELEIQSEELFKTKLLHGNISLVCNSKKTQYKGYTFKYITKEEYEKRIPKII